jgi:hypothetical protein
LKPGAGILYGYWKSIPISKKKAAFSEIREGMEDGKLTISEGMAALEELF